MIDVDSYTEPTEPLILNILSIPACLVALVTYSLLYVGIKGEDCVEELMNSLNIISKEQLTYTFRDNYTYFEETFSSCDLTYSLPSHDYWRSVLISFF